MMKISLYNKPLIPKALSLLLVATFAWTPFVAQAGFFSGAMSKVWGVVDTQAQAAVDTSSPDAPSTPSNNSQTMGLIESSNNPDLNGKSDAPVINIDSKEALVVVASPLSPSKDLEQYASSAKISTYTVKRGDTLASIAKKFKITENAIVYANSDLKKSDILKVGQNLVILPLKAQDTKIKPLISQKPEIIADNTDNKDSKDISSKDVNKDTEVPSFNINTDTPSPSQVQPLNTPNLAPIPDNGGVVTTPSTSPVISTTPTGQPSGSITGGYIWPLPEGVGRVSQGLHADQAYDFAAPIGTPIYAVQAGTVLIAHPTGYNGGYGKYVVVNFNDGRQAIFGHMSKVVAEEGDVVKQGDIIGYVGSTGHSTGPHVHIGFHGPLGNPYLGLKINSTDLQVND